MPRTFSPSAKLLLFSGSVPVGEDWLFFTQNGPIVIQQKNQMLSRLLPLCDGSKTASEIAELSGEEYKIASHELLGELFEKYALVDRMKVYEGFMNYLYAGGIFERDVSANEIAKIMAEKSLPPLSNEVFSIRKSPPTSLGALAATRRTTYVFGSSAPDFYQVNNLFWSMYGIQGHFDHRLSQTTYTVPSGGALYGLRFDLFLLQNIEGMEKGHYLWRPEECGFEWVANVHMPEVEQKLFNPKISIENVAGAFTISADLERLSKKYGNSSLPLAYLEAGHAFQNGYLFASQENLGIAEIFGFRRRLVEEIINGNGFSYYSLTCGIFGSRPN